MGNSGGKKKDPDHDKAAAKSKQIDKNLKDDKRKNERNLKVLFLGTGESGKSTLFKQLKIIYHPGTFNPDICVRYRDAVYENVVSSMRTLCMHADKFGLPLSTPEAQEAASSLMKITEQQIVCQVASLATPELWNHIKLLWKEDAIQKAYDRRNEYYIVDSAHYFMENLDRIAAADFVPSQQDVLHCRIKTTGIQEVDVTLEGYNIKFIDVGGQRSERRKWISLFDDVTTVLFIVSLCEYDQVLYEDSATNRMKESMSVYDNLINNKPFTDKEIIIFYNKKDLFAEKIKASDPGKHFPEYSGGCNYDSALAFIKECFAKINRNPDRRVYSHSTCATDTQNVSIVFNTIKDILLFKNLTNANLV